MVPMKLSELFSKVVFLIGAGASKDAGCKLSNDMLKSLKEAINNLNIDDERYILYKDDFAEIYSFILASLNYQKTIKDSSIKNDSYLNIEDFIMVLRQLIDKEFIIPYPLIGNWNDKILKWELKNGNVFDRFKEFITKKLIDDWTLFNEEQANNLLHPIRTLLNSSEDFKLNIFSLNYDLIFETVFNSSTSKLLDDGFSEKNVLNLSTRYWAADFDNENSVTKLNYYKLHGSLGWEYNKDTEEISIKENINDGREPLIIFGSYSKMLSIDPFLYILSKFRDSLEKSTIFIIIGYSFHDKYINNLLIQQLSQNTTANVPKKLLVVNPSYNNTTESQFTEELKQIQDSKSYNDVINFKYISPDRIKIVAKTAANFYLEYFTNNAQMIENELFEIEQNDRIFT